jgi:hypothetical protein
MRMLYRFARRCAVLFVLLPASLCAIVFDPLSIESLTKQADVVLQGTVLSKTCQRDPAGRIYTRVELQVTELWKGAVPGSPFVIVRGGGVLGERQSVVAGQVQYDIGEEVVVFLVRNGRGEGVTLGLMQGKFHIWREGVTGSRFVVNPFHGAPETAAGGIRSRSTARPVADSLALLELAELKKRVLEASR